MKPISDLVQYLIFIYGLVCYTDILNSSLFYIMRLKDKILLLDIIIFAYLVVLHVSLGYVFCFVLDMKSKGLVIAYCICDLALCITNFTIITFTNWANLIKNDNSIDQEVVEVISEEEELFIQKDPQNSIEGTIDFYPVENDILNCDLNVKNRYR